MAAQVYRTGEVNSDVVNILYIFISRSSWFTVFWLVVRLLVAEQVHETGVLGILPEIMMRKIC